MWSIQLFKLNFDEKEVLAASSVVESGWLSMGEKVIEFEDKFSNFLGSNAQCAAVSNGTAALHAALLAGGIGPGDEVIIPSLTFVADINVVELVGANAVLADSTSLENWNMSAGEIKKKISNKTKAVIIVHYAGYPCEDIEEISNLCKMNNILLIEDVAHAPGASVDGKKCGTWGDIGCFSFFSNKNLSIGEGGMVSSCDAELTKKLKYIRSHGMTSLTLDRHKGRSITYDVAQPGLNYRMDEIRAAIGLEQLKKLSPGNSARKNLTDQYRLNFKNTKIFIPYDLQDTNLVSAYHILPILLPENTDRVHVIEGLKKNGIQSSIHYPPFWSFEAYRGVFDPKDTPNSFEICNRQLTLPLYPTMTVDEVNTVCKFVLDLTI